MRRDAGPGRRVASARSESKKVPEIYGSTRVCCTCPCIFNLSNLRGPWLSPLPPKTPTTAELFGHCGVLSLAPGHAKEMLVGQFDSAASFFSQCFWHLSALKDPVVYKVEQFLQGRSICSSKYLSCRRPVYHLVYNIWSTTFSCTSYVVSFPPCCLKSCATLMPLYKLASQKIVYTRIALTTRLCLPPAQSEGCRCCPDPRLELPQQWLHYLRQSGHVGSCCL